MDIDVKLNIFSKQEHISQIISGFMILAKQGMIKLDINECYDLRKNYPHNSLVEANINGKTVAFDVLDGYNFDVKATQKYIDSIDYYFKRSFSKIKNSEIFGDITSKKMYPLGLNYHVTFQDNPLDRYTTLYTKIKKLVGYKTNEYFTPDKFEVFPQHSIKNFKILFSCRLWDLNTSDVKFNKSVDEINKTRINIAKNLKKYFGDKFYGGIAVSTLSKKMCPELLLPKSFTNRGKYIEIMKNSDVCVATTGLHYSIGWKTAEYVAASKAIVSEELNYELPGNFENGKNYYSFKTADECLEKVNKLIKDPELIYNMKMQNYKYYKRFLQPHILILNTLNIVLDDSQRLYGGGK